MTGRNGQSDVYELMDVPPLARAIFVMGWNDYLAGAGYADAYEGAHPDHQVIYESGRLQCANTVEATGRRIKIHNAATLKLADKHGNKAARRFGYPVPPDYEAVEAAG